MMKALQVDWLKTEEIDGVKYGCDINYNVWNLKTEEKIFHEDGIGEIDLRDVIHGEVTYQDSDEPFTFRDFLYECLEVQDL